MAWIESNQEVGRHPKTKKLARLLDISMAAAVGHLHYLWWWALDFAQEGLLSKFDECDIAEACMWEGDAKKFVDALVQVGFIDQNESVLSIHDWYEYAGRLIEKRQADADRKQRERDKRKKASNKISRKKSSVGCPTDVQGKSTDVQRNSTVPYPTVPLNIININSAREEEILTSSNETGDNANDSSKNVIKFAQIVNGTPKNVIEKSQNVNESSANVTRTEEVVPMVVGTKSLNWAKKNWGRMLSPGESGDIISWCDEFTARGCQEPDAVVIEALKQCDYAGVRNMKYLRAILTDWRETGVLTVAQVDARETEHQSQKVNKRNKDPGDKPPKPLKSDKYEGFYL